MALSKPSPKPKKAVTKLTTPAPVELSEFEVEERNARIAEILLGVKRRLDK